MTKPVCITCSDTHRMTLGEREVMCTRCPRPCQQCRRFGYGPYCEVTPCACGCHKDPPPGPPMPPQPNHTPVG
jgi:hypothetical protein